MAKKNTTLKDLSNFLNQEIPVKKSTPVKSKKEFIQQEPTSLAPLELSTDNQEEVNKPEPAKIAITIPAIKQAIEHYAATHQLTEEQVLYKINPLVVQKNVPNPSPFDTMFRMQQHYMELWITWNKAIFKL